MNIQTLVDRIKEISLNHQEVQSFNVGNTWDMAASKSSDVYPAVWVELPILVEYTLKNTKTYSMSIDVLMLPKQDDVWDEMSKISQCEAIADQLMQAYQAYVAGVSTVRMTGLTVKNLNADLAVGCRIDLQFITNRECDFTNNFTVVMQKE